MHHLLLIDEILRSIFFQVGAHDDAGEICSRSAYAALATVCRAWKDPALDFLWEKLPSTDPLVALLPTVKYDNGAYAFTADPSPEELANLSAYASRVRSVFHNGRPSAKFLSQNLSRLLSRCESRLLFPALASVSLHVTDPTRRTLAPALYHSARLRSVTIDVGFVRRGAHPGEALCAFVEGLTGIAKHLERFSLRGRAGERMLDAITTMGEVRSLSLCVGGDLSPRMLAAFGNFAHLNDLRVQLDGMDAESLREALEGPSSWFASLVSLQVRGAPATLEALLEGFPQRSRLQSLRLESDLKPRSVDCWIPVFTLLASKTYDTLQDLTVEVHTAFCEVPDLAVPPKLHFTVTTLAPLAGLVHLRAFKLDATVPADINDADVAQIARWWPEIERLVLWTCPPEAFDFPTFFTAQPRATPASLRVIANSCPALRVLHLPLDIATLPASNDQITLRHPLERITIGCVKKETGMDVHGFAACLHSSFPLLSSVEIDCGDDEPWTALQNAYTMLQV